MHSRWRRFELFDCFLVNTYHRLFVERVETVDVDPELNFRRFVCLYLNTKIHTFHFTDTPGLTKSSHERMI